MSGWLFDYSLRCQPVDYSYSPKAIRVKFCSNHLNMFVL